MNRLAYMIERSATYFKNDTALISEDKIYTFEEVHLLSNALKNSLQNLGVKKGDRIGVYLPNSAEYVITDFSLIKGGYVRVPINSRLVLPEIEHIINDSGMSTIVYHHSYLDKIKELIPKIKSVKYFICVDSNGETEHIAFEDLLKGDTSNNYESVDMEDNFQILYTSGTTGKPKGALTNVLSRISSLNNVFIDEINIQPSDVMIHVASLAHGGGTKVLPHFVKGATNVLMSKFDVTEFLENVEKYQVTTTWMVPTMIGMLIEHPDIKNYDLSSLETIVYAGAPMPVAVLQKAIEIFGNIFVQVYGLSEAPNPDLVLTKKESFKRFV